MATIGINALCDEDKAFILRVTDGNIELGPGSACKQYPTMTYCDSQGIAWLFIKWLFIKWLIDAIPEEDDGTPGDNLDVRHWQVCYQRDAPGNQV